MQRKGRSRTREHSEERRVGLARALSKLGFCSRAKGFELVHAGRVRLHGITPKNTETPVRLGKDRIEDDGAKVTAAGKIYWRLNKTRGAVTTAEDERGSETEYARM